MPRLRLERKGSTLKRHWNPIKYFGYGEFIVQLSSSRGEQRSALILHEVDVCTYTTPKLLERISRSRKNDSHAIVIDSTHFLHTAYYCTSC